MSIIVRTDRITVREYLPNELETYLNHFVDEKVALYIPKRSRKERTDFFNDALIRYRETKVHGMWGIFNNADGEFIGGCLLRPYEDNPDILELGYSLEQKYWGQGIATEMAIALTAYGLNHAKSIVACVVIPNIVSQRVLVKAGFKQQPNAIKDGEELAYFTLSD